MTNIDHQIQKARPLLRTIAPLTYYVLLGFGLFNIALGLALLFYKLGTPIVIISPYTPSYAYGWVFIILGLFGLFKLWRNDWKWLKRLLILGLLVKSTWLFALVIRLLQGGNGIILALWMFITYVQAVTYIHFIPDRVERKK